MPTDRTAPDAELSELAASLRADSPTATIEAVMGWVHERLEYVPGVTGVQTSALEASHAGRGCLSGLRSSVTRLVARGRDTGSIRLGIPAPEHRRRNW